MSNENVVINLATAKVLKEEADYMNALRRQHDLQVEGNPVGAEDTITEMIKEARRLNPKNHIADEEEVIISILDSKK